MSRTGLAAGLHAFATTHCIVLIAAVVMLAGCGGGGGGSSSGSAGTSANASATGSTSSTSSAGGTGSSGSNSTTQPLIVGQILSFPPGAAPASYVGAANNTAAFVVVMNQSGTTPLTNATVTVNGTALNFQSSSQEYSGSLNVNPGSSVSIVVTVSGVAYDASYTLFNTYPTITSPAPNSNWSSQNANVISWTGVRPDPVSQYLVGVIGADGTVVWPSNDLFQQTADSSFIIPSGSLTTGARMVLVGIADVTAVTGGATGSSITYAGFNYQPITVFSTTSTPVSLLSISPLSSTVAVGSTVQLMAAATMSDGTTQDVTAAATWQSSSSTTASVSNTGAVTGAAPGNVTITATYEGASTTANVLVFQTSTSPAPPLSQAVAYHIDYAHSGFVTFGGNGPTFPPAGNSNWSITLDSMIFYPLIANGSVFVATENSATNSQSLYALNETSGAIQWGPVTLPGGGLDWAGIAYDQGSVFAVSSGSVTGGVTVQAFNAATGALEWNSILAGSYDIASPPTAVNGIIYLNGNGYTYALDERTGNKLWSAQVESGVDGSPTVSADGVFVAFPCQAYKFDPISGAALWHYSGPCDGGGGETPVYANGLLYIQNIGPQFNQSLIFNAQTGVQQGAFAASAIPAVSSTTAFYLDSGTLSAFDLGTQTTLWTFQGDGQLTTAPIIIDGTVVIGSASGTVYALNAATGAVVWNGTAGSTISSSPWTGIAAGEGWLVVPAGNALSAWKLSQ